MHPMHHQSKFSPKLPNNLLRFRLKNNALLQCIRHDKDTVKKIAETEIKNYLA